jgi:hypothetical protein
MTHMCSGFRIPFPRSLGAVLRSGIGMMTVGLAVISFVTAARAQTDSSLATARAAILIETRAFQRDLAARDWNGLLLHFWPAKITARWEPPVENPTWAQLSVPGRATVGSGSASRTANCRADVPAVAVVGRWARVLLPTCAARPMDLWLLDVNGHWKIVRLDLGEG